MNPSIWPEQIEHLWAKSADKGVLGQAETLAQHTWSVLAQLAELKKLRPDLPDALNTPAFWDVLYWAGFFHDFGKTLPDFQQVLRGGPRWPQRHELFSLAFLDWLADGFSPPEQDWLTALIVSHHKEASDLLGLYLAGDEADTLDFLAETLDTLTAETIQSLWVWAARVGPAWQNDLGLNGRGAPPGFLPLDRAVRQIRSEGAQAIYRRLERYERFIHTQQRGFDPLLTRLGLLLRGHLVNADHSASAHVDLLPPFPITAGVVLEKASRGLYPHQRQAWETDGSALLIAPTGSGKTEAALLWAARQAASHPNGLPRLFYTLPYQASMNAMLIRLQNTFQTQRVGLQHGRGLLAQYRLLMERSYAPRQAAYEARLAKNLAELNQFPIRVFSPYQMLKGAYRLKGYEPLLMDYFGAAFIFDEIHAYEPARLAMIFKLLAFLREQYQSCFFVMSATFPSLIRSRLRQALGSPAEITASEELSRAFLRHRLFLQDGDLLENLARIDARARKGGSVLVVCNRVDRAQAAYQELQQRLLPAGIQVALLHGRFNMRDRSAKEALIRGCTGVHSAAPRPLVLVATQAVEVSLDIDLDTIYTDPAPLEALVQRFGRINRARKQADLAPVYVFRQPDDGQKVYAAELVQRTLALLEREHSRPIDEGEVGVWVDEIYQGEVAQRWQAAYETAADDFERACLRSLVPFQASQELEEAFYAAFDSVEVLPESLYPLYIQQQAENPILSDELLVPIRYGRYHALANAGLLLPRDKTTPPIVRCAYDSEIGLNFDAPTTTSLIED